MPKLDHLGDLYLDYPYSDPAFYESYLRNRSYNYFVIGLVLTLVMVIGYTGRICCVLPGSRDRGWLVPHVLAVKGAAFAMYPSYGEYVSFCYGFMTADFPWMNALIGSKLANPLDKSPAPYSMYFTNLSLASTYFLPLLLIPILWFSIIFIGYICEHCTSKL